MPIANPLVNSGGGRTGPPPGASPVANPGGPTMQSMARPMSSESNLPIHVGTLILLALGVIVLFNIAGFKFVVAGSVGAGK